MRASYILDTRTKLKDGTSPLKVRIYHDRNNHFSVSLKIYVLPEQWDGKNIIHHDEAAILNPRLTRYKLQIGKVLLDIDSNEEQPSLAEVRNRIEMAIKTKSAIPSSFFQYFDAHIHKIRKISTRGTFEQAFRHVKLYDSVDKGFAGITVKWLKGFEEYCYDAGLSVNTTAIYLRNIRTLFNNAIDDGVAKLGDYPFRRFKIKKEKTLKRSLSIEQIRTLRDYDCEPYARQYIDIFMLIFYLRGINMIDLFNLKKIEHGYVEYRRAKTGRLYSVKIEPEALEIINKYKGKKYLLNIGDRYANYKNYLHRINRNLKEIGTVEIKGRGGKKHKTGLFPDLSTYWARHTWATIAAGLDIPKETIAAALGHGGNTVTDIYIDFDQKKVDAANRKVIDAIK